MRVVRWIAGALMLLSYLIARGELGAFEIGEDWLVGWALCTILTFLIVLIHELGHAVAAWRVGGFVRLIVVFPFQFDVRSQKLGLAVTRRRGDIGGYVAYRLHCVDVRRKHMIVAAAGPASNLATAALALSLTGGSGVISALAGAFATLSIGIGVGNLLPFEGSDGHRLVKGMRHRPLEEHHS